VADFSGGYVIHLAAGTSGFVAAAVVGPRIQADRDHFPPNSLLVTLIGAGILWLGWNGFNGGDPYFANHDAGAAVLNTNTATAVGLLVWTLMDKMAYGKPSVIGAVNGMIAGLVAITPGAGYVDGWGAIAIGVPGWPDLAFWTASMHRVRIVLTQISSIEPVGAIKSSLSDLAEVTAASCRQVENAEEALDDLIYRPIDVDRDRIFSGAGHRGVAHLILSRARNKRHSLKIHAGRDRIQPALSIAPRNTGGPLGSRFGEPPAGSSVTTSSPAPANSRVFSGETAMRLRPAGGKRPS